MHLENRLTVCGADNDQGPLVFVVAYQVRDYGLLIGPIALGDECKAGVVHFSGYSIQACWDARRKLEQTCCRNISYVEALHSTANGNLYSVAIESFVLSFSKKLPIALMSSCLRSNDICRHAGNQTPIGREKENQGVGWCQRRGA